LAASDTVVNACDEKCRKDGDALWVACQSTNSAAAGGCKDLYDALDAITGTTPACIYTTSATMFAAATYTAYGACWDVCKVDATIAAMTTYVAYQGIVNACYTSGRTANSACAAPVVYEIKHTGTDIIDCVKTADAAIATACDSACQATGKTALLAYIATGTGEAACVTFKAS